MLKKIISGGQTGADMAGLMAGRALKIPTGGTAPKFWMTENGSKEKFLQGLGLVEGPTGYKERTRMNVRDADATVIFGITSSAGTKLTIRYAQMQGKLLTKNPTAAVLRNWIKVNDIQILNVAGNRESKNSGIGTRAFDILVEALENVD